MNNETRKVEIALLKESIKGQTEKLAIMNRKLQVLKAGCVHTIEKKHSSAFCSTCETFHGWWCPDSPDHICDYNQEDGGYDEDSCRYCGHPEERK